MHFSKEIVSSIVKELQEHFGATVDFTEPDLAGVEISVPFYIDMTKKVTLHYPDILAEFVNGFVINSVSPVGELFSDKMEIPSGNALTFKPQGWQGTILLRVTKKQEEIKPVVTAPNENERDPFINAVYDLLRARDPELKPLDQLSPAKRGVIERHIGSLYLLAKL